MYIRTYKHTHMFTVSTYMYVCMRSQSMVHMHTHTHNPLSTTHTHKLPIDSADITGNVHTNFTHKLLAQGTRRGIPQDTKIEALYRLCMPTTISSTLAVTTMGISGTISVARNISVTSDGAHQGYYQHSLQALWNVPIHHILEENAGSRR